MTPEKVQETTEAFRVYSGIVEEKLPDAALRYFLGCVCSGSPSPPIPPKRKAIQIATTSTDETLWALCNDGTVWGMRFDIEGWVKFPAIPQDDESEGGDTKCTSQTK